MPVIPKQNVISPPINQIEAIRELHPAAISGYIIFLITIYIIKIAEREKIKKPIKDT